jgi:hypothetical protein
MVGVRPLTGLPDTPAGRLEHRTGVSIRRPVHLGQDRDFALHGSEGYVILNEPKRDIVILACTDPSSPSVVVAKQPFSQANLLPTFFFTDNCFHRSVILFVIDSKKFPPSASRFWRAFIPGFFRVMT